MPLEDQLRRWGCWLTLPNGSHTHTPLKETVGGPKQEGNNSDHLELERTREAGAYVDDTVLTQSRPPNIHLRAPSGIVPTSPTFRVAPRAPHRPRPSPHLQFHALSFAPFLPSSTFFPASGPAPPASAWVA